MLNYCLDCFQRLILHLNNLLHEHFQVKQLFVKYWRRNIQIETTEDKSESDFLLSTRLPPSSTFTFYSAENWYIDVVNVRQSTTPSWLWKWRCPPPLALASWNLSYIWLQIQFGATEKEHSWSTFSHTIHCYWLCEKLKHMFSENHQKGFCYSSYVL